MSKRDQLDYVQLDVDFYDKPKIRALEYDHGPLALTLLSVTLCDMGRATNAEIEESVFMSSAKRFSYAAEKALEILSYLIERGIITRVDGTKRLTNTRIIEDQEAIAKKRDSWRERQSKSRDKSVTEKEIAVNVTRDNAVTLNTEDHEDLNFRKGVQGGTLFKSDWLEKIPILSELPTDETRAALRAWAEYSKKINKSFDWQAADSMMKNGAFLKKRFPAAIHQAIQNGWRNVRFDALPEPPIQKPGSDPEVSKLRLDRQKWVPPWAEEAKAKG